jgi:hypothetical protein
VVIRVYSAHLTVAGEASLRRATHRERLPKTLTSPRCNQVRALLVGRGICESGEFRGTRQPGAFDPESSHLKIFHGFFETLSKRRRLCGGCRPRRTTRRPACRWPHDAGDAKIRLNRGNACMVLAKRATRRPHFSTGGSFRGRKIRLRTRSVATAKGRSSYMQIRIDSMPPKKLTITSLNGATRHALIPRQHRTGLTTTPEKPHL